MQIWFIAWPIDLMLGNARQVAFKLEKLYPQQAYAHVKDKRRRRKTR